MQAIHPGPYDAMPTMAWPMYEPAIWGRSGLSRLTIVPESGVVGSEGGPEAITRAKAAGKRAPRRPRKPTDPAKSPHCPSSLWNGMIEPLLS